MCVLTVLIRVLGVCYAPLLQPSRTIYNTTANLSTYNNQDILLSCATMLAITVSAEHNSNTISLVLNHQKNICVNFFISKSLDLFTYTNPTIAYSSYSTHTCIQLDKSVNTLVDNTHSSYSIDYCITRSISHIPCTHSASTMRSGLSYSIQNDINRLAVHKSGEKIEIFVGRHSKFSPTSSCAIRQP